MSHLLNSDEPETDDETSWNEWITVRCFEVLLRCGFTESTQDLWYSVEFVTNYAAYGGWDKVPEGVAIAIVTLRDIKSLKGDMKNFCFRCHQEGVIAFWEEGE